MSLLRAFIAVEIPSSLQHTIQESTASLRKALGTDLIRWVPPQNVHLTLKFLGDVSPSNLNLIKQMLTAEAGQHPCFEMQIKSIGSFPNSRRLRVIWVGLHAPAALESLQRGIESASARLGYAADEKSFSPHLTIGRVKQNLSALEIQRIRAELEKTKIGLLGVVHVDGAHLFKSDLQSSGSVYTKLFSAKCSGLSAPIGKI
ncbi:MAG: RNA 2',3'-cyclic phosphodiesterase [Anaerolineales bacterium]